MVGRDGIESPTPGFSDLAGTTTQSWSGSKNGVRYTSTLRHGTPAEGRLQFSSANRENLYGAKCASLNATIAENKNPRGFEEPAD